MRSMTESISAGITWKGRHPAGGRMILLFPFALLMVGCYQECHTLYAGYEVGGIVIDGGSGTELSGEVLRVRLEGETGTIGPSAVVLTDEEGEIRHFPENTGITKELAIRSTFVVTDTSQERCATVSLFEFAGAMSGRLGPESVEGRFGNVRLVLPPRVKRAVISRVYDPEVEVVVEITDELLEWCENNGFEFGETVSGGVFSLPETTCYIDLGTVTVPVER